MPAHVSSLATQAKLRWIVVAYLALVALFTWQLARAGDLSTGRNPIANLVRAIGDMAHPSFLDAFTQNTRVEYKSDDGRVLRVEDKAEVEIGFLRSIGRAVLVTLQIATLGSFLAVVLALPLAFVAARNSGLPRWIGAPVLGLLSALRSIHTLVFGLVLVGIVGLGPTAGILAIALHSLGSYGKLFAETIEAAPRALLESGAALGLTRWQTLWRGLRRGFYAQWLSTHLYLWEFNVRDSTVLGLIGAGGLGLLVSEAVSLFQWDRLATLIVVIVALVACFDRLSGWLRTMLLSRT
ncbi:MAG: PhnE/PtxC family ABC transporter permease [Casimicrobium sp.]